ncbi:hypothetical protein VV02_01160 [Luteipulveratus mongoliensis]|uniref:CHAD domain-containing protein n=1 Tax=Luteipulveratus mongoliensis TaxID=571913 RepID=A0A0K1JDM3_9MICO|nr:hypothetical protein VV02_01160 [Luteipulveratus mongoliensis]
MRDLDVTIAQVQSRIPGLGPDRSAGPVLLAILDADLTSRRADLTNALSSDRYTELADHFRDKVASIRIVGTASWAEDASRTELARLRGTYGTLGREPTDHKLHDLRIAVKHARYSLDLVGDAHTKPLARALKSLQMQLGDHQDAVVCEELVRAAATPETLLAGRIIEHQHQRRAVVRAALPDAWDAVERAAPGVSFL